MDSKRIIFFGGQGSRLLCSSRPVSRTHEQHESSVVSLLLSTCHAAFLREAIQAQSQSTPTWAKLDTAISPESLLTVPHTHSDNPILHGVCLCVNQLVGYLEYDNTLEKLKQAIPIGFCSGMLPAMVLACSNTVEEYIKFSGEAVRLAYWIGYRAAELSQGLSGKSDKAQLWGLSLSGKDRETVERNVQSFNSNVPESSHIRLASRFGKTAFSIVGPGHALEAFRSLNVSASCKAEEVHVHALYHGGDKGLTALSNVLEDVRRRDISFPPLAAMNRPIWSCENESLVGASTLGSTSPLEYTLRLILVDKSDLYSTWLSAVDTVTSSGKDWEIITVGPGSNALLASVCRDVVRPANTIWIDVPGGQSRGAAELRQSDSFAIVGMSVNFPLGEGKEGFWEMLEQGLNAATQVRQFAMRLKTKICS